MPAMEYLRGQLLVAEPRLPDPNFFRSVVLVIEHTEQGATGIILNRPGNVRLSEIWEQVSESPLGRDETIYVGGPVQGPLTILHEDVSHSEHSLMDGLHIAMQRENLNSLLVDSDINLKVFSGYSGWGPGQLEQEMKAGGWLTWPAQPDHVFGDAASLYKSVCDAMGADVLFGNAKPKNFPEDPTLN